MRCYKTITHKTLSAKNTANTRYVTHVVCKPQSYEHVNVKGLIAWRSSRNINELRRRNSFALTHYPSTFNYHAKRRVGGKEIKKLPIVEATHEFTTQSFTPDKNKTGKFRETSRLRKESACEYLFSFRGHSHPRFCQLLLAPCRLFARVSCGVDDNSQIKVGGGDVHFTYRSSPQNEQCVFVNRSTETGWIYEANGKKWSGRTR